MTENDPKSSVRNEQFGEPENTSKNDSEIQDANEDLKIIDEATDNEHTGVEVSKPEKENKKVKKISKEPVKAIRPRIKKKDQLVAKKAALGSKRSHRKTARSKVAKPASKTASSSDIGKSAAPASEVSPPR